MNETVLRMVIAVRRTQNLTIMTLDCGHDMGTNRKVHEIRTGEDIPCLICSENKPHQKPK